MSKLQGCRVQVAAGRLLELFDVDLPIRPRLGGSIGAVIYLSRQRWLKVNCGAACSHLQEVRVIDRVV